MDSASAGWEDPVVTALEFRITFEGSTDGLAGHRLSIARFGDALPLLLWALQRTASGILMGHASVASGRISAQATAIDLELVQLEHNCASPVFECVVHDPTGQSTLWPPALAEQALQRLVEDIHAECTNGGGSPVARAYVQALPHGLERQNYRVTRGGQIVIERHCGRPPESKAEAPTSLPRLTRLRGQVAAVGFAPGPTFVTIRSGDKQLRLNCDAPGVDRALRLRGESVQCAALLTPDDNRLLWIREDVEGGRISTETTATFLREHWLATLERLAQ